MTIDSVQARREAALRFLQTVVVVDDHAYTEISEVLPQQASLGDQSLGDESVGDEAPVAGVSLDASADEGHDIEPQEFFTEEVVEGFADLGIYCAVLRPSPDERDADHRRLQALAGRADIVILDWILHPLALSSASGLAPADRTSVGFVRDIVQGDLKGGGRTRLICIYTGEADAHSILTAISSSIADHIEQPVQIGLGTRRIDVGATRILVLGKERRYPSGTIESVSSSRLPNRIVDEFAEFAVRGLLREVALDSLSAVRDESHRLLRRFDGDLDPALLSHRSATSPADADQFARNLVGSELASIILAAEVTRALSDERVDHEIDKALGDGENQVYWRTFTAEPAAAKTLPRHITEKALKKGIDADKKVVDDGMKLEPRISRTSLLLTGETTDVRTRSRMIDAKFSVLSAFARDSAYEGDASHPPRMQLGAVLVTPPKVVSSGDGGQSEAEGGLEATAISEASPAAPDYWVCLQPLCDSVRLEGSASFPMLKLEAATDQFHYLLLADGDPLALMHSGRRLTDVEFPKFQADPASRTVKAKRSRNEWTFNDVTGQEYRWIGSLRLDKAHKVLHSVVNFAGRIGIDEFDFLRAAAPHAE